MHAFLPVLGYLRRQPVYLALIGVLTFCTATLLALQPWPMKLLADQVLGGKPLPETLARLLNWLSVKPDTTTLVLLVVAGGLFLYLAHALLDAALTWCWTAAGRRLVYAVAEDLFAALQRRSVLFHSRQAVGDTMGRITVDSWCVYQVVEQLVFSPAYALVSAALMVALMVNLDVQLTILALVLAPFMVAASFVLGKPLRAAAKLKREIESRVHAHIQQTLTGIPVVQAFVQEERESERLQKFAAEAIRNQQKSALLGSINGLSSGLITAVGSGIILWVSARNVLAGDITVGSMLVFLVYLNSLQTQVKVFAGLYSVTQRLTANVNRVNEVLQAPAEVSDAPGASPLPPVAGAVEFQNVTTGYESGRPVLKHLSLSIKPGQTVAIVGATGAGKTTLVNLIPRFADPWEGRVLIDGQDVRDVQLKSLRGQVAVVLQDPFLFPISIAENIAYGRPEASREDIHAAARAANADAFITALPQGYDTVIGERGATLSGGERQRVAIARALLRNPPILILDEPTSALDASTEHAIIEALQRLMQDRTTFVIAHRLSTIRRADLILVLRDGQIAESGTHEQLLARGGHYAHLHQIQDTARNSLEAVAT
jgi:ATP-binding cassette subfamily B protein